MATKDEIERTIRRLMAAFPRDVGMLRAEQVDLMVDAYAIALEEFHASVIDEAVKRLLRSRKNLPTASEIRGEIVKQHVGNTRPGGDAWGEVLRAVSKFGFYRTPEFSDPVTARAVHAIGWRDICSSTNIAAERARFIQLYDSYARIINAEQVKATIAPGAEIPALVGDVIEGEFVE